MCWDSGRLILVYCGPKEAVIVCGKLLYAAIKASGGRQEEVCFLPPIPLGQPFKVALSFQCPSFIQFAAVLWALFEATNRHHSGHYLEL